MTLQERLAMTQAGDGGFAYFSGEDNESINIEERYCVE